MQIDRSNYEIWLIDWLDGNLNNSQIEQLEIFLKENPGLKEEFEELTTFRLNSPKMLFQHKNQLKKTSRDLSDSQLEYLSVAYLENDLSVEEKTDLLESIEHNKEKKSSFELIQKIKDSANFLSGYQTVRQVGLGRLDMAWHNLSETPLNSVAEFEANATKETDLFPPLKGINTSCAFSHIFHGGYSAGYYSYKWAEVLEADTFEFFLETGVFNKETANKFKEHILSKGGSEHPMELYKKFRGQEPSTKPLLKKSGLLKK